jgi:hypothetical protein
MNLCLFAADAGYAELVPLLAQFVVAAAEYQEHVD